MASIRQHGNGWQARIRRKGHPDEAKSFATRQEAQKWARAVESAMDRGGYVSSTGAERITLVEIIARYRDEVTPTLKGAKDDAIRLRALMRHPMCRLAMTAVTPSRIAQFRDDRLQQVSAGTVVRELACLSAIINHARREWGVEIENPVSRVRKPPAPIGRNRVLSELETARLLEALRPLGRRSPWMLPLVVLALETAMRRGELLALRRGDLDLDRRTATLHDTKNGDRRVVPLSSRAMGIILRLPVGIDDRLFPISSFAVAAAFNRAVVRAGINDLRFHDLRHTAITRLAERLPNLIELAAVSGHRSLKMLQRYYHPIASELAQKLG